VSGDHNQGPVGKDCFDQRLTVGKTVPGQIKNSSILSHLPRLSQVPEELFVKEKRRTSDAVSRLSQPEIHTQKNCPENFRKVAGLQLRAASR
jgi:hypothetical protein